MEAKLQSLSDGTATRDEAASWARRFILDPDIEIEDPTVLAGVIALMKASLMRIQGDPPYTLDSAHFAYGGEDFRAWLNDFRGMD